MVYKQDYIHAHCFCFFLCLCLQQSTFALLLSVKSILFHEFRKQFGTIHWKSLEALDTSSRRAPSGQWSLFTCDHIQAMQYSTNSFMYPKELSH